MKEIQDEVEQLIIKIEDDERLPYRADLLKVLRKIHTVLGRTWLNQRLLRNLTYGIARMTTDDGRLESRPIGQELLALASKLDQLQK